MVREPGAEAAGTESTADVHVETRLKLESAEPPDLDERGFCRRKNQGIGSRLGLRHSHRADHHRPDHPLAGATVTVEGTDITATTDDAGRFQLSAPPGRITLRADFGGFRSTQKQLTVTAGKPADVDLPMSLDQTVTHWMALPPAPPGPA